MLYLISASHGVTCWFNGTY